jgi:thiol:disulfide interchange protein DsbD
VGAESQGCADIGVCYPPQIQKVTLSLPAAGSRPGMPVEAAPQKKSWLN